jgi:hypothetical protein
MGVRHGEFNLLRWLDTFIFYSKMNGNLQQLHRKWMGEDMWLCRASEPRAALSVAGLGQRA